MFSRREHRRRDKEGADHSHAAERERERGGRGRERLPLPRDVSRHRAVMSRVRSRGAFYCLVRYPNVYCNKIFHEREIHDSLPFSAAPLPPPFPSLAGLHAAALRGERRSGQSAHRGQSRRHGRLRECRGRRVSRGGGGGPRYMVLSPPSHSTKGLRLSLSC